MIIVLHGKDTYRTRVKLGELVANYQAKYGANMSLRRFDAETFNLEEAEGVFKSISLFKSTTLIVFDGVFSSKHADAEALIRFFKERELVKDGSTFLIVAEEKLPSGAVGKFLSKPPVKTQEFKELSPVERMRWAGEEVKRRGVSATVSALKTLVAYCGVDTWRLAREIEKLASWKRHIDADDLSEVVAQTVEPNVFDALSALGERKKGLALKLFRAHLTKGDDPMYLLSMIAYQLRTIAAVKRGSTEGPGRPGRWPPPGGGRPPGRTA